jgi:hypothetical protein
MTKNMTQLSDAERWGGHEALLAPDRDDPNLEMALRRLRRIEDILRKSLF